jgi:hypothetical protein
VVRLDPGQAQAAVSDDLLGPVFTRSLKTRADANLRGLG